MRNQSQTISAAGRALFFFVAVLLSFLLLPQRDLFSNDTWWHLALGDQIRTFHGIPSETFSYTAQGQPIFCHWWLSDVVFSWIASVFGLAGLEAFGFLLVSLILLSVATLARSFGASTRYAVGAEILFFLTAQRFLILRPQLFTALLLAWILIVYLRSRELGVGCLLTLPFLFVVWVNLHGGFLLGLLLLLGLLCFEAGLSLLLNSSKMRACALLAVFLASALASLLNPYGMAAFSNALRHDPFVQGANQHIDEWLMPTLVQAPWLFIAVVFAILLVATRRSAPTIFESVLFFAATVAAFLNWRHVLLFGLLAVPILAAWSSRAVEEQASVEDERGARVFGMLAALMLLCVLSWQLFYRGPVLNSRRLAELFPVHAVEWALRHPQNGNMFNNYEWGGYLVYAFRGHPAVYIDSRLAPFLAVFPDEYYTILNLATGWKETMAKRAITWVLVPTRSQMRESLESKEGWVREYSDETATILRAQ